MGFKSFLRAAALTLTISGCATSEGEIAHTLSHPNRTKEQTTPGTEKLCEGDPQSIVNNVCKDTNKALIEKAVLLGYTCHSATVEGKIHGTCEIDREHSKCNTTAPIETSELLLEEQVNGSQVYRHTCLKD